MANYPASAWNETYLDAVASAETSIAQTDANTKCSAKTLLLEGAIVMRFTFTNNNRAFEKAEMLAWKASEVKGAALTEENVSYVIEEVEDAGSYGGFKEWRFYSEGVPSKDYSDTLFVCAKFTDAAGNVSYSDITAYSPEAYAARQLELNRDAELVELCKRMTIYGEFARTYFNK